MRPVWSTGTAGTRPCPGRGSPAAWTATAELGGDHRRNIGVELGHRLADGLGLVAGVRGGGATARPRLACRPISCLRCAGRTEDPLGGVPRREQRVSRASPRSAPSRSRQRPGGGHRRVGRSRLAPSGAVELVCGAVAALFGPFRFAVGVERPQGGDENRQARPGHQDVNDHRSLRNTRTANRTRASPALTPHPVASAANDAAHNATVTIAAAKNLTGTPFLKRSLT